MERLTVPTDMRIDETPLEACKHCVRGLGVDVPPCGVCQHEHDAFDRLTAYESTGLSPEEVAGLAQAKRDGRLVELPCKVGDAVYYLTGRNTVGAHARDFNRVEESRALGFYAKGEDVQIRLDHNWQGNHGTYGIYGKTIFLTREEAEAALETKENA